MNVLGRTFSIALVLCALTRADVIPADYHFVARCAKIVNTNEFPDIVLVGVITGPMVKESETYVVDAKECLELGYKFNSLVIVWTSKEHFKDVGMQGLEIEQAMPALDSAALRKAMAVEQQVYLLTADINPFGGYVPDSNPLVEEDIDYEIYLDAQGTPGVYLSQRTARYNNGDPQSVEEYESPVKTVFSGRSAISQRLEVSLVSTHLFLSVPAAGAATVSIFDRTGRLVMKRSRLCKAGAVNTLGLAGLQSGAYVVSVKGAGFSYATDIHLVR